MTGKRRWGVSPDGGKYCKLNILVEKRPKEIFQHKFPHNIHRNKCKAFFVSLDEDPLIHLDVALPQTASCLWMHHQSHQCRCRSRDREMQEKWWRKRANRWLCCSSAGRQATRRRARRGVRCPVSGPHGGNRHFQESCLAAMEPGRDSRGAGALQLQQRNHPHPIQLLEYQRGGVLV